MKTMELQNIKMGRNEFITMDVKAVRKFKGVPEGMIYPKDKPARLVIYVESNVPWNKPYWLPKV